MLKPNWRLNKQVRKPNRAPGHERRVTNMRIPLTRIQKLIGERMSKSKLNKPCFYIESKADVTELMALRPKLSKSLGVKITSNTFFIRALALAAKKYPVMVGSPAPKSVTARASSKMQKTYTQRGNFGAGENIKIADSINIGFAVNASQGVIVPVIKNADKKTLAEIAWEDKLLTEKARSNRLTLAEIEGQTIALSNLGVYGIDSFFGIVPPPTSTILAVGNVVKTVILQPRTNCTRADGCKPAAGSPAPKSDIGSKTNRIRNKHPANPQFWCGGGEQLVRGKTMVRKITSLSLAVDRRIINEAYAAQFLNFITGQLQNPQQLI